MAQPSQLHLLGVRHHGPGSAASVCRALDAIDPAVVLVEGPPDAEPVLRFAAAAGMRPPVALLVHAENDPALSSFYPFAEHSPEWQAIHWALTRGRRLRCIDLPMEHRLALQAEERAARQQAPEPPEHDVETPPEDAGAPARSRYARDPLGMLAAAAGESDGETWWNALVEQGSHGVDVFAAIEAAMTEVRAAVEADVAAPPADALLEERREASMRLAIHDARKDAAGAIAVVCGAWHVPALRRDVALAADRKTLKGLPRIKTTATWVPWTETQLAFASGYGAGVVSPGWYRHLWRYVSDGARRHDLGAMTARWQAGVADLLRREGLPAATASVIEATRLATSLAALRGFSAPGLAEMQDASLAALCHGEPALLQIIEARLVIGDRIGEIDESVPQMPLLADLTRWQKRLRLKPQALDEALSLDLRSDGGLQRSILLHRLNLIEVPWGRRGDAGTSRGTFRENWILAWAPELSVKLAEALRWGTTIEQAAAGAASDKAAGATSVVALAVLVESCLNADVPDAAERCITRLQELAVNAGDITGLMRAAVPLANVLRYGTARKLPREALGLLVSSIVAEVCIGLAHACRQLDDAAAAETRQAAGAFDHAVGLLEETRYREAWHTALGKLLDDDQVAPMLRGFAARRLYEQSAIDPERTAAVLSRALSPSVPPNEAGGWLEGFLGGAAQILLHDRALFAMVDRWLQGIAEDDFINLLPAIRRAVAGFDAAERRRLLDQVKREPGAISDDRSSTDDARIEASFAAALPLLHIILGLDRDDA